MGREYTSSPQPPSGCGPFGGCARAYVKKAVIPKNHRHQSATCDVRGALYAASSAGSCSVTRATFRSLTMPIALKSFSVIQEMSNSYQASP